MKMVIGQPNGDLVNQINIHHSAINIVYTCAQ